MQFELLVQTKTSIVAAVVLGLGLVACAAEESAPFEPAAEDAPEVVAEANQTDAPPDSDPDFAMSALAASPDTDAVTPAATQDELIKTYAPHMHLNPDDVYRPASVDWYLARVTMRFDHSGCPDHELVGKGKLTQALLVAQEHEDNKSLCRHDDAKEVASTTSDHFFLEIQDESTRKGSPRTDWKTYAVWRPHTKDGLVDIEYWIFYPYNDGFSIFNHESDWEHIRVTIDPKANRPTLVKLSAHKGGTYLKVGDPKLKMEGTHPVVYVAKGTHANYPAPGVYEIEGTKGIAKDTAKAAAAADVWKTETTVLNIGTRARPKNGQVFVKYWGRWGEVNDIPETNGITRHFP